MEIIAPSHCRVQRKGMAENQEHFIYGNKGQQIWPQAEICHPQNTRASLNLPYQTALALRLWLCGTSRGQCIPSM